MNRNSRRAIVIASVLAIASGCGGGGGSGTPAPTAVGGTTQTAPAPAPSPAPAPAPAPVTPPPGSATTVDAASRSAEGLWIGSAGADSLTAVVLGDGQYWITQHRNGVTQAVVQGTSQSSSGVFTSTDAKVLNGASAAAGAISGQYVSRERFDGVIAGTAGGGLQFSTSYATSYATAAQTAAIVGSWAATVATGATARMSIATSGLLSGTDSAGCAFTGYVLPRSSGTNVYTVTLAFGAAPCALASRSASGVAYVVPGASGFDLVVAVADENREGGFGARFSRSSSPEPVTPPPPPPPPPPDPVPPPPDTGRVITGAELLKALKGYAARQVYGHGGPPIGYLFLSADGSSRYGSTAGNTGSFYAWSQLMWGGQGTVSNVTTSVNGSVGMTLEFMVGSGSSGYIANMALGGGSERIRFEEVHTINEWDRIALDRDVFTWRRDWGTGSALVRLIVQSIDGSATGYRVCWLTQYGVLNRLACSVHGRDYAAYVVDDYFGNIQRSISTLGDIPWNSNPPAGTPAPPPNPNPMRYVYGFGVVDRIVSPLLPGQPTTGTTVTLRDSSGRTGTLTASASLPYGQTATRFSSSVDGQRSATVSFSASYNPYGANGPLSALTLSTEGEVVSFPGEWQMSRTEIYPLDRALVDARSGGSVASLILQSFDGAPQGYRVCWLTQHRSLNRLYCAVGDLPGTDGFMVDDYFGNVRTFR